MAKRTGELTKIIQKFADSGWDVIDAPSKAWLDAADSNDAAFGEATSTMLISAIEEADELCGSCGCEFDPLYKRSLELLKA